MNRKTIKILLYIVVMLTIISIAILFHKEQTVEALEVVRIERGTQGELITLMINKEIHQYYYEY